MTGLKSILHRRSGPLLLIALALTTSGIFKIAAFAREAFIAATFGLSAVTDAYFALQQFPMTVASYTFGAFTLAFAPAFADARRENGSAAWLPGLVFYGILAGIALTLAMLAAAPILLHFIHSDGSASAFATLQILSLSFAPVVCIGIWTGVCTARGQNNANMIVTGLPFLVMTLWLLGLWAVHMLSDLSLPVSMTAGFGVVGLYAFVRIVALQPASFRLPGVFSPWRFVAFRAFLRQLGASSLENAGFAANQLLIIYSLSRSGVGIVSANNCAMRIGMIGYTIIAMPMTQLVQAKVCASAESERPARFRRWLVVITAMTTAFASAIFVFRIPIIRIVYMHGKFQGADLNSVAALLPAWIAYICVISINAVTARYLFIQSRGSAYVRRLLAAYAAASLFRLITAGRLNPSAAIWSSVVAEGLAMILNLRSCLILRTAIAVTPALEAGVEAA